MPRRARPASRPSPHGAPPAKPHAKKAAKEPELLHEVAESVADDNEGESGEEVEENEASDADDDLDSGNESEDADAPRVVQWADDEEDWEDEPEAGPSTSSTVQKDLSTISLGTLRDAQRTILRAEAVNSSDEEDDDDDGPPKASNSKGKQREVVEWSANPKPVIQARSSKHAPVEVTSKRPVSRKRTVIEVKTFQPRDPRFLPLTGEFSAEKYEKNYAFLSDAHKSELHTLRDSLKRAKKMLQSSPRNVRAEREAEVERLERAVKRSESEVNKDKRTQVERKALERVKKDEKEKREQGKGSWFMKDAEKKTLLTKARYEAIAASGGDRAVKKAIDKRQKKIGQKEKKSRPFSAKRSAPRENTQDEGWSNKRRRIE